MGLILLFSGVPGPGGSDSPQGGIRVFGSILEWTWSPIVTVPSVVDARVELVHSTTMLAFAEVPATQRTIDVVLNQPGSMRFSVPLSDPIASMIEPIKVGVRVSRDGVITWHGMVWGMQTDTSTGMLEVSCVGWLELLNHRELREDYFASSWSAGTIVSNLITTINLQLDAPDCWLAPSFDYTADMQNMFYSKGKNVGAAIKELCEVENGIDVWVEWDPTLDRTRPRRLRCATKRGKDSGLFFGYGTWPENLAYVREIYDPSTVANRFNARSDAGVGTASDADAIEYLGQMFEESATLSDVSDLDVLTAYAGAEVAYRARPPRMFELGPLPATERGGNIPKPFLDYDLGDTFSFSCDAGRIQVSDLKCRIFGITMTIDENGNETVTSLKVSAS